MIDQRLVRLHLASGMTLTGIYGVRVDQEDEEIEAEIIASLNEAGREFVNLGGLIVHTGAVSAVELV